jgi:hypothetical protein
MIPPNIKPCVSNWYLQVPESARAAAAAAATAAARASGARSQSASQPVSQRANSTTMSTSLESTNPKQRERERERERERALTKHDRGKREEPGSSRVRRVQRCHRFVACRQRRNLPAGNDADWLGDLLLL